VRGRPGSRRFRRSRTIRRATERATAGRLGAVGGAPSHERSGRFLGGGGGAGACGSRRGPRASGTATGTCTTRGGASATEVAACGARTGSETEVSTVAACTTQQSGSAACSVTSGGGGGQCPQRSSTASVRSIIGQANAWTALAAWAAKAKSSAAVMARRDTAPFTPSAAEAVAQPGPWTHSVLLTPRWRDFRPLSRVPGGSCKGCGVR